MIRKYRAELLVGGVVLLIYLMGHSGMFVSPFPNATPTPAVPAAAPQQPDPATRDICQRAAALSASMRQGATAEAIAREVVPIGRLAPAAADRAVRDAALQLAHIAPLTVEGERDPREYPNQIDRRHALLQPSATLTPARQLAQACEAATR